MKNKTMIIVIVLTITQLATFSCVNASSEGEMVLAQSDSVLGGFLATAQEQKSEVKSVETTEEFSDHTLLTQLLEEGKIVECAQCLTLAAEDEVYDRKFRSLLRIQLVNRMNCLLVKLSAVMQKDSCKAYWFGRDCLAARISRHNWSYDEEKLAKAIEVCESSYRNKEGSQKRLLAAVVRIFAAMRNAVKEEYPSRLATFDRQLAADYIRFTITRTVPIFRDLVSKVRKYEQVRVGAKDTSLNKLRARMTSLWKAQKEGRHTLKGARRLVILALRELESYVGAARYTI